MGYQNFIYILKRLRDPKCDCGSEYIRKPIDG